MTIADLEIALGPLCGFEPTWQSLLWRGYRINRPCATLFMVSKVIAAAPAGLREKNIISRSLLLFLLIHVFFCFTIVWYSSVSVYGNSKTFTAGI